MKDAAWAAFVQQLRDGGMKAYQAAKTKDQDKMIEASNAVNASCEGCHRRFRNPRTPANRCK
jgi:cytochrome c556